MIDYEKMFNAAVAALAEVSNALGVPDDEAACANGNDLILGRIAATQELIQAARLVAFTNGFDAAYPVNLEKLRYLLRRHFPLGILACDTCGGTKVDPGGLGLCRTCGMKGAS